MLQISPFPNIRIFISEKRDGSVNTPHQAQDLLKKHELKSPICYFHHHHQATRYHCSSKPQKNPKEVWADAAITNQKVALAMKVADCFPIVLSSKDSQVIALIHGGWKPLLQNIIELTILDLQLKHKLNPDEISTWIGPGIHGCCYHFKNKPIQADLHSWQDFTLKKDDYWQIDLAGFIKQELTRLGVDKDSIIDFNQCTSCNYDTYFSHYKNKQLDKDQGRMVVAIETI